MSCHPSGHDCILGEGRAKVPPQPTFTVDESMVNVGGDFEDLPCFEVGTVFLFLVWRRGKQKYNRYNPFFLKDETKNPKKYMNYMYYVYIYIYWQNFPNILFIYTMFFPNRFVSLEDLTPFEVEHFVQDLQEWLAPDTSHVVDIGHLW